jgi:hypothetical protein
MTAAAPTARSSSRRAEANRANSRKSTGPSAAGQQRSKYNALKHGLRAQTVVLPGEDPAAYEQKLHEWIETLQPANPLELELVHRGVNLAWQLDRLERAEAAYLAIAFAANETARRDDAARRGAALFQVPTGAIWLYPDSPGSTEKPIFS